VKPPVPPPNVVPPELPAKVVPPVPVAPPEPAEASAAVSLLPPQLVMPNAKRAADPNHNRTFLETGFMCHSSSVKVLVRENDARNVLKNRDNYAAFTAAGARASFPRRASRSSA
jgi:hypothetical protein